MGEWVKLFPLEHEVLPEDVAFTALGSYLGRQVSSLRGSLNFWDLYFCFLKTHVWYSFQGNLSLLRRPRGLLEALHVGQRTCSVREGPSSARGLHPPRMVCSLCLWGGPGSLLSSLPLRANLAGEIQGRGCGLFVFLLLGTTILFCWYLIYEKVLIQMWLQYGPWDEDSIWDYPEAR